MDKILIIEDEAEIAELEKEVKEKEATIANLTKPTTTVKNENVEEKIEKPVKKVRRRAKKNIKKEE